jgi:hypothetical protein
MIKKCCKYIETVELFSGNDKIPYGYSLVGKGVSVHFIERLQGHWKYDNKRGEQIIFSISFEDPKISITSKVRNTAVNVQNERELVEYVLEMMEQGEYEYVYYACLYITKLRLQNSVRDFRKEKERYERTGFWNYPYNTNPKAYALSVVDYKRVLSKMRHVSIDNMKFFKRFLND